jgi:hypothetical protein
MIEPILKKSAPPKRRLTDVARRYHQRGGTAVSLMTAWGVR